MPPGPLRFGPGGRFELRPAEYRLLVDGQPAALGSRALDLLMALAGRPQVLLTKSELLDRVWPGLVVEEGNLRVQINTLRRLLGEDAIATVPGRGYRFSLVPLADGAGTAPASIDPTEPTAAADQAPPPRLIGRSEDLARLEDRLRRDYPGCITLAGMPGVGKSSLARLALARWAGRRAWVDLAPLTQGHQVPGAIARALGGQLDEGEPGAQLLQWLAPRGGPLLLVLDNAEHLIPACAEWAATLRAAPQLRLLVTSQVPLSIGDEQVLRLEPLPVAAEDTAGDTADTPAEGALALLVERIGEADRRFQPMPASMPLLRALCRQLDGLPLALEMAAARVPLMGLRAVHDALAERFSLLSRGRRDAPARHRTLHDALDWSYALLAPPEQRLFRALGVFTGGFTLDLAVSLTADEHVGRWEVVDGLATLAERSLVSVSADEGSEAPPRYRLLETMRAYALEKLATPAAGATGEEASSLRRRHAGAVLALFSDPASDAQCLAEMDNAREAFLWAREHELALAAQLGARVAAAVAFTLWRQEATEWMLSLRPAMEDDTLGGRLPLATQAHWWSMLAYVMNVRRDAAARPAARRAVSLYRQVDAPAQLHAALAHWVRSITEPGPELDEACAALAGTIEGSTTAEPRSRLRVHGALAEASRVRGDARALLACREQELLAARELGWEDSAQAAETNVCTALMDLGRHAEAAERGAVLLRRMQAASDAGTNGNLPWALNMLVESLVRLGRLDEALALVPHSLAASRRFGTTVAWQGILTLVAAQQRHEAAARLIGHVRHQWALSRATPDRDEQARVEQVEAEVHSHLGADRAVQLSEQGQWMDDDTAAALAAGNPC